MPSRVRRKRRVRARDVRVNDWLMSSPQRCKYTKGTYKNTKGTKIINEKGLMILVPFVILFVPFVILFMPFVI